jgi:dolichol-phosphate mannosyltransferase
MALLLFTASGVALWSARGNVLALRELFVGSDRRLSNSKSQAVFWFFILLTSYLGLTYLRVAKGGFDFVLLDRKPMDVINSFTERNRFYQYDILSIGFNLRFIPYLKEKRVHGTSQYNFLKRFNNFYTAFLNVSYYPLRLMTITGFLFSISSIFYGISIIYAFVFHKTPFVGWAPLMLLLLLIGGLIMIMLGVIGEYIWRLLDEVKNRPKYIVKEIL